MQGAVQGPAILAVLYASRSRVLVELDPTRMCELLVGLPDVNVLAVEDRPGGPLGVHVETRGRRPGRRCHRRNRRP